MSTLALDLRGHGRSQDPFHYHKYRFPFFCKDINKALHHVKVKDFSFIGHSLGTGISAWYCHLFKKKPLSIVFVEGATTYPYTHGHPLHLPTYLSKVLRNLADREKPKNYYKYLREVDLSRYGFWWKVHLFTHLSRISPLRNIIKTLDNVEEFISKNQQRIDNTVHNLTMPILALAGSNDTNILPKHMKRIKVLNKKVEFKMIKGATHGVIFQEPERINKEIEKFLKSHKIM